MNDRSKLAEAVFYGHVSVNGKLREDFDPFTDANDDYAVLEWMREQGLNESNVRPTKWDAAWDARTDEPHLLDYQIGDYAWACLKVIATEQEDSDE